MIAKQTTPMTGVMNISSAGPHRDEGDRDAGQRAEQRRARRDLADDGRDEAAGHQHEALDEHPGEPGLPALDRIAGLAARSAA